jgi:alpha-amylase
MIAMARAMICEFAMSLIISWIPAHDSYDIWDLGEFDQKGAKRTNWGTKEELLSAIKAAAEKGIITYIDAVMNHKRVQRRVLVWTSLIRRAGADDKETFKATMVDENDRNKFVGEMHDIEGWTK